MKRTRIIVVIIFSGLLLASRIPLAEGGSPYLSRVNVSEDNLVLFGVDFSTLGFRSIVEYIWQDTDTLVAIGYMNPRIDTRTLLFSYTASTKKVTIIRGYSPDELPPTHPTIMFFPRSANVDDKGQHVALKYILDPQLRIGRSRQELIEIFSCDSSGKWELTNKETIADVDSGFVNDPSESEYWYPRIDDKHKAAVEETAKIYFTDINKDGVVDIVIWKRIDVSRMRSDPAKEHGLRSEEFYAMYGQKGMKAFKPLQKIDPISYPSCKEMLWEAGAP